MGEAPPQLQELWPPRQAREAALPPPGRRKPMLYLHEASKAYSAQKLHTLYTPNKRELPLGCPTAT